MVVDGADDVKSAVEKATDFDAMAARYTEDAIVGLAEGEPIQGREAIRNFFAEDDKYIPNRSGS